MASKKNIFISHVAAEAQIAAALKSHIETALPDVLAFASSTDIDLGLTWLKAIYEALSKADAVIVLCSRWSVERRWINFEAGAGWGRKTPVIPLCHGTMRTEDLPDLLQALQGLNIHNAGDCEQVIRRLSRDLHCQTMVKIDFAAMARDLKPNPTERKPIIALDLNHGQHGWPIPADSGRDPSARTLFGYAQEAEDREFYALTAASHFLSLQFRESAGLIFAAPRRSRISPETINLVKKWVFSGGRLLLLGFELGDLHHDGNLADLANQFGIQFGTDIVGPPGFGPNKPYGFPIDFLISEADPNFLTADLEMVTLPNVQTVRVAPGGIEWLRVGRNILYRPAKDSVEFVDSLLIQPTGQHWETIQNAGAMPVAVFAPKGLCGAGAVCAIGTWQLRSASSNSQVLLNRLLDWLSNGSS